MIEMSGKQRAQQENVVRRTSVAVRQTTKLILDSLRVMASNNLFCVSLL